ncbi:thiamine phosphate synthase [Planococcus sp. NCCP-2050]|uniref:thiamine phosphate synthase n=1 Tax=Planococcus sp. NCCP-2050 TaxID=2944679 RepID=UPI00203ADF76|nr:thiamine phosphate synthase [Planococcus sp. NCCP-2050]GKW45776.1 thiamine-phosphate synthase [Planococcus sp. NCCP-2050]
MSKFSERPVVYFILGTENAGGKDPLAVLEEALKAGIDYFQLREKGPNALKGAELLKFALDCKELCQRYQTPLLVNDDIELAWAIGADGVHIGQDDAPAAAVRKILGADKLLGVSVHSLAEAKQAVESGADYVGMGPVFATSTKADAKPPAGVAGIQTVKEAYPNLPIVGIGGISSENAAAVWKAGALGVAVITAISHAADIAAEVSALRDSAMEGAHK